MVTKLSLLTNSAMRNTTICTLLLLAPLAAQNVDILGATSTCPSGTLRAKANQIRVDQTVLVLDFEMYLDVPAAETLEFFAYRHHSRTAGSTLDWTLQVPVQG